MNYKEMLSSMEVATQNIPHEAMYKNKGMTSIEMRKRREIDIIQLRKQKRDDEINKRRNIKENIDMFIADDDDSMCESANIFDEKNLSKLFSNCLSAQESAMHLFRRRLCFDRGNCFVDEAIALGLIDRFVLILTNSPSVCIRRDAASILSSIVAGTSAHTECVVRCGAVPVFIHLLSEDDEEIREHSLLAIANIAADQCSYRDLCLSLDVMPAILRILNSSTELSEIRSAVWTISNLCRGKNPPPDFSRVSMALPALSKQLFTQDMATLADACRAVASLSEGENSHIEVVVQSGVVRRLVELLLHPNPTVSANALRAIGNIVTGTDQQTQVVLSCSALECLEKLLVTGKDSIKKEVCWTLSNILAGNRKQIQTVIDAHILPSLIGVLASGDFKTRKEACWAIGNALSGGNASQVAAVVREGAILPLCDLLTVMEPKIVSVVLNALDSILRHGENIRSKSKTGINPYCALVEEARGVEKLEFLQQSPNLEIYVKAFDIIENYFAADEEVLTVNETNNEIQSSPTFDF